MILKLWDYDTGTTTKENFGYDKSGNIRSFSRTVNEDGVIKTTSAARSYYFGENNRLIRYTENNGISIKNPVTSMLIGIIPSSIGNFLQYDDDGNLVSSVRGDVVESYKFNQRNNLTSYCQTEYTYDAEGNRIKVTDGKEEIRYLYNTNQSLPKVIKSTTNGLSTIYIYGKDLISEKSGKDTSYYHFDYRGSTVALTDISGKITDKYQYDVYGSSRHTEGISETPFRYNGSAGVMTDSNNLLYMKSRYYDINTSRFISADVITGDIRNTQSLNRYTYCEGNPVNFTDPFGLSPEVKAKKQAQIEAEKRELISEKIHGILDVAGMAPFVVGMAADGLNGVIYIFEGDLIGASFSAIAFIPAVGEISTPTKHGGKLALATASSGADNVARMAGRYGDDAAEIIINNSNSLNKAENLFNDFAKEPFIPEEYYKRKIDVDTFYQSPNTSMNYKIIGSRSNTWEDMTVVSDEFGRIKYRIDHSDHAMSNSHDPEHIHIFQVNTNGTSKHKDGIEWFSESNHWYIEVEPPALPYHK